MPKTNLKGNLAVAGFNDIFQQTAADSDVNCERVVEIPLGELFPPEFHPFHVVNDSAMERLVKSVKEYGVREPGLARPRADGGYELIAGNRRKRASEIAGIPTMPVIVREMDDNSATIAMVDSNLEQREKLLFSEKAWAYRVKLEALNHRGAKSDDIGQLSVSVICEQTGESRNTVFRLIRLTELVPDLLDMVDTKKLAFHPAVDLSYLSRTDQAIVADCMTKYQIKPSLSQAVRLKKASTDTNLTPDMIESILSENSQAKPLDNVNRSASGYKQFFPENYTSEQMDDIITNLLRLWKKGENGLILQGVSGQ